MTSPEQERKRPLSLLDDDAGADTSLPKRIRVVLQADAGADDQLVELVSRVFVAPLRSLGYDAVRALRVFVEHEEEAARRMMAPDWSSQLPLDVWRVVVARLGPPSRSALMCTNKVLRARLQSHVSRMRIVMQGLSSDEQLRRVRQLRSSGRLDALARLKIVGPLHKRASDFLKDHLWRASEQGRRLEALTLVGGVARGTGMPTAATSSAACCLSGWMARPTHRLKLGLTCLSDAQCMASAVAGVSGGAGREIELHVRDLDVVSGHVLHGHAPDSRAAALSTFVMNCVTAMDLRHINHSRLLDGDMRRCGHGTRKKLIEYRGVSPVSSHVVLLERILNGEFPAVRCVRLDWIPAGVAPPVFAVGKQQSLELLKLTLRPRDPTDVPEWLGDYDLRMLALHFARVQVKVLAPSGEVQRLFM